MSVGGKTTSRPSATHCLWTSSTSATHTDIHTPLSAVSSPSGPNVEVFAPLPRPPCPPRQRKISHSPDPTAPNVGGVPQSQHFFQPHFSNHAKLAAMSDTFKIGVMAFAYMARKDTTPAACSLAGSCPPPRIPPFDLPLPAVRLPKTPIQPRNSTILCQILYLSANPCYHSACSRHQPRRLPLPLFLARSPC